MYTRLLNRKGKTSKSVSQKLITFNFFFYFAFCSILSFLNQQKPQCLAIMIRQQIQLIKSSHDSPAFSIKLRCFFWQKSTDINRKKQCNQYRNQWEILFSIFFFKYQVFLFLAPNSQLIPWTQRTQDENPDVALDASAYIQGIICINYEIRTTMVKYTT